MPTVPVYDTPTVDLQAGNMPAFQGVNVQPAENYSGKQQVKMGESLMTAGNTLIKIQDQIDDARAREFENKFSERARDISLRYQTLDNQAAIDARPQALADLQAAQKELEDGLENNVQRTMFRQYASRRSLMASSEINTHHAKAAKTYDLKEQATLVDNNVDDAILSGKITARRDLDETGQAEAISNYRLNVGLAARNVNLLADKMGLAADSKQRSEMMQKAMTRIHAGILDDAINANELDFARSYLTENKKDMGADAVAKAEKALEIGTFDAKTQDLTESLLERSGGDFAKAVDLARGELKGKEEDAVIQRLKIRAQENEAFKNLAVKNLSNQAWSLIMDGKAIPRTLMADLVAQAPEELRQIRDWQDAKRRQAKAEKEEGFGFDTYYGMVRMAMDEPAKFAEMDLRKSEPYMTKGQLNSLVSMQVGINKNEAKSMQSQRVMKQTIDLIKAEVTAAGIDLTPKEGTEKAKQTAKFLGALTAALDDATREKGAPLTNEEAKRIGMGMLREGYEQGTGIFGMFMTKRRGYEFVTDPNVSSKRSLIAAPYKDIPKAIRDELIQSYMSKTGTTFRRSLYGDREYIVDNAAQTAIEQAYTQGVNQGRFK